MGSVQAHGVAAHRKRCVCKFFAVGFRPGFLHMVSETFGVAPPNLTSAPCRLKSWSRVSRMFTTLGSGCSPRRPSADGRRNRQNRRDKHGLTRTSLLPRLPAASFEADYVARASCHSSPIKARPIKALLLIVSGGGELPKGEFPSLMDGWRCLAAAGAYDFEESSRRPPLRHKENADATRQTRLLAGVREARWCGESLGAHLTNPHP